MLYTKHNSFCDRVAALDREEAAGVVYLAFREVFDTVSHDLPSKLRKGSL